MEFWLEGKSATKKGLATETSTQGPVLINSKQGIFWWHVWGLNDLNLWTQNSNQSILEGLKDFLEAFLRYNVHGNGTESKVIVTLTTQLKTW